MRERNAVKRQNADGSGTARVFIQKVIVHQKSGAVGMTGLIFHTTRRSSFQERIEKATASRETLVQTGGAFREAGV